MSRACTYTLAIHLTHHSDTPNLSYCIVCVKTYVHSCVVECEATVGCAYPVARRESSLVQSSVHIRGVQLEYSIPNYLHMPHTVHSPYRSTDFFFIYLAVKLL